MSRTSISNLGRLYKESSTMNIEQVAELIEKTVVLLGQVNTTCLYERRVNWLAKIFKSDGTAKLTPRTLITRNFWGETCMMC